MSRTWNVWSSSFSTGRDWGVSAWSYQSGSSCRTSLGTSPPTLHQRFFDGERSIEVIAGDEPVVVSGWRDDIFRALRNLIENALGHSPEGGLISIEVGPDRTIAVRDQGSGFSADLIDPVLRRKRVMRSDRRGGFGLGLSIVDKTMEAHRGELALSNRPSSGCAEMRFPRNL